MAAAILNALSVLKTSVSISKAFGSLFVLSRQINTPRIIKASNTTQENIPLGFSINPMILIGRVITANVPERPSFELKEV